MVASIIGAFFVKGWRLDRLSLNSLSKAAALRHERRDGHHDPRRARRCGLLDLRRRREFFITPLGLARSRSSAASSSAGHSARPPSTTPRTRLRARSRSSPQPVRDRPGDDVIIGHLDFGMLSVAASVDVHPRSAIGVAYWAGQLSVRRSRSVRRPLRHRRRRHRHARHHRRRSCRSMPTVRSRTTPAASPRWPSSTALGPRGHRRTRQPRQHHRRGGQGLRDRVRRADRTGAVQEPSPRPPRPWTPTANAEKVLVAGHHPGPETIIGLFLGAMRSPFALRRADDRSPSVGRRTKP